MNIWGYIKSRKDSIVLSVAIGFAVTSIFQAVSASRDYAEAVYSDISRSVVRFHVLPNSNEEHDQALKLMVRDEVLHKLEEVMKRCEDKGETLAVLSENLDLIQNIALSKVQEEGYDYNVKVSLSNELFPYKEYKYTQFPAGYYDTLKIEIGNADGGNWWCVMYPPLCYVDITSNISETEFKSSISDVLSEESYTVVVTSKTNEEIVPKVKFKIVEMWQDSNVKVADNG